MLKFKKSLILVLMGVFIVVFSTTHSNAQGPSGHGKGGKEGWTGDKPPGWQKGEKEGWGEGDAPPGLEKGEKKGWTKEEKIKEKARERELKVEEGREVLEEEKQEEVEVLEKGRSEEAKEMAVTKGKKGGRSENREKGKAWWKFWKREKKEAE